MNQINANYTKIDRVGGQIQQNGLPAWKSTQLDRELASFCSSSVQVLFKFCSSSVQVLFKPIFIYGNPNEESERVKGLADAKMKELLKNKALEAIQLVHREYQTIRLRLQS